MLKEIQSWLSNPKRIYSEGLKYFNQFASLKQKESFGEFLNAVDSQNIDQFDNDGRFPVLINQVVFCERRLKSSPEMFKQLTAPGKTAKKRSAINIDSGTSAKKEVSQVITDLNQLPENFSPVVTRLKELVPYMAKVHADMAAEVADDKRAILRAELITLDDERRHIWERIDKYLAGIEGSKIEKDEVEKDVEQNMLLLGHDFAKKIGLLKSYITRNTNSLKKHQKAGNEKKAAASREKIEMYTKELKELQALLPKE